jgi:DNA-directed RNA polymerase specialized sigma24 family protein
MVRGLGVFRHEPALTEVALTRLLEWLDDGVDSAGETYLAMRRRLVSYFDRRNRPAADELADETLNRIGRTLEKDGAIATTPPARYCYTVAKFVLLEDLRHEHKQRRLAGKVWSGEVATTGAGRLAPGESLEIQQQRLECLERCLHELNPDQRALVIEYYRDARRQKIERRREIAQRLGITMNALSIRVSRIRTALEASVETCRKEQRQM